MLSKDPKSTPIDPASVLKDEAINQVKNRVQSKVNETLSTPTQKVAGMASAAASLTQSASASANRVTAHPLIHGGGFTGGQTFAENQALQAAHGALLDALGMDSLESG
ncbi:type VI secretion system tip protein VgrG, partial [Proteus mirabilis]